MILCPPFLLNILGVLAGTIGGDPVGTVTVTRPLTIAWDPTKPTSSPSLVTSVVEIDDAKQKIRMRGVINGSGDLTQDNRMWTPLLVGYVRPYTLANVRLTFFLGNSTL